jgi:hypothetical protein
VVTVSYFRECCSSAANFVCSKYFPPTETSEDQSKNVDTKEEAQKEQVLSEDKTEGIKKTQSDDKMIDSIKSELEVEADDQTKTEVVGPSKSEKSGQELGLPDVPTTEPSEHGLPEAKKLKLNDD